MTSRQCYSCKEEFFFEKEPRSKQTPRCPDCGGPLLIKRANESRLSDIRVLRAISLGAYALTLAVLAPFLVQFTGSLSDAIIAEGVVLLILVVYIGALVGAFIERASGRDEGNMGERGIISNIAFGAIILAPVVFTQIMPWEICGPILALLGFGLGGVFFYRAPNSLS